MPHAEPARESDACFDMLDNVDSRILQPARDQALQKILTLQGAIIQVVLSQVMGNQQGILAAWIDFQEREVAVLHALRYLMDYATFLRVSRSLRGVHEVSLQPQCTRLSTHGRYYADALRPLAPL